MKNKIALFFLSFITASLGLCKVQIAGIYLDLRLDDKSSSPYGKIIKKLIKRVEFDTSLKIYPTKRARLGFFSNSNACLIPSDLMTLSRYYPEDVKKNKFMESNGIEHVTSRLFVKKNKTPPASKKDVLNKSVISWTGIPSKALITDVDFEEVKVTSELQGIKMLNANRADYLLGWIPDTILIAKKNLLLCPSITKT